MGDGLRQVHGWVRPGTKESWSLSCNLSSKDPTRHTQHWRLLLQRVSYLGNAAIKATPSAEYHGGVPSCMTKTMLSPSVGGGGLPKAAHEDSWSRTSVHWPLHHTNSCRTPWRSHTQELTVLCISGYICTVGPCLLYMYICQYDRVESPSRQVQKRDATARNGCQARTVPKWK
jgi:hypothetical protein